MGPTGRSAAAAVVAGILVALPAAGPALARNAGIELISVSYDGTSGDDGTSSSAISGDGRYVVFISTANDLVAEPYLGLVYLRDRLTGRTVPVALSTAGERADDGGYSASISHDGRYVAFSSLARNLVPDDDQSWLSNVADVFVRDVSTGTTARVSLSSAGVPGNQGSEEALISGDGRFVAFLSAASNLVPGDTNGVTDLFVHDRGNRTTRRAGVSSTGGQANAAISHPAISGNGRYVSFWSAATNLVPGDTNGVEDAFVRDLRTGTTSRITVSGSGAQADAGRGPRALGAAPLSNDGRYVAFSSQASNLVPGDGNAVADVFLRDRLAGTTTLVSTRPAGGPANDVSTDASISADGRTVAFSSHASNLVPGDTNRSADIFVRDIASGRTSRVNVSDSGGQATGWSYAPRLSANGRMVAFTSGAADLVPGDYNNNFDIFVRTTV